MTDETATASAPPEDNTKPADAKVPAIRTNTGVSREVAPLMPKNLAEAYQLSKALAASRLTPKGIETAEQVLLVIQAGSEVGFAPSQSLQSFAVINGRVGMYGDAIPALLWSRGFKLKEWFDDPADPKVAFCRVTRPEGDVIERSFSVKQATKAKLIGKQGPWTEYPERMLQMRARAWAARDGAADVLRGLPVYEEIVDIPAEEKGVGIGARLTGPGREGFSRVMEEEARIEAETREGVADRAEDIAEKGADDYVEEAEFEDAKPPAEEKKPRKRAKPAEETKAEESPPADDRPTEPPAEEATDDLFTKD